MKSLRRSNASCFYSTFSLPGKVQTWIDSTKICLLLHKLGKYHCDMPAVNVRGWITTNSSSRPSGSAKRTGGKASSVSSANSGIGRKTVNRPLLMVAPMPRSVMASQKVSTHRMSPVYSIFSLEVNDIAAFARLFGRMSAHFHQGFNNPFKSVHLYHSIPPGCTALRKRQAHRFLHPAKGVLDRQMP